MERKTARKAYKAKYKANNREKILEQKAKYRANHKDEIAEYNAEYRAKNKEKMAEYRSTPFGRANNLVGAYRLSDKKQNRGDCTIDAQWILDNVFSGQVCHYCGETDWKLLGVDRINNSLPHTPDNVVPCCWECNLKKHTTSYDKFMKLIEKTKGA